MSNSALGSQSVALLTLPAGTLIDYAGTIEPSGWMLCDGRAVSRTTYASLFAAISTSYGDGTLNGNGASSGFAAGTAFNLPDFRGRFARYNDNMGTSLGAAGRDTFARSADKSQAQATAKNGLSNSSSSVSVSTAPLNLVGSSSSTTYAAGSTGSIEYSPNQRAGAQSLSGTASAQTITGDAETRPINLSCNKLIKI